MVEYISLMILTEMRTQMHDRSKLFKRTELNLLKHTCTTHKAGNMEYRHTMTNKGLNRIRKCTSLQVTQD